MKVHYGLDNIPKLTNPVVTSGTFDGVHIGHKTILDRLKSIASNCAGTSVVLTYWPHPRFVLSNDTSDLKILSSIDEKIDLLDQHGIDHLVILPFTKEFSNLSSEEFISSILINTLSTHKLVIGYDHRFGKNREGSFEFLSQNEDKLGFQVEEIPRKDLENIGVSSTLIRKHLSDGEVDKAIKYLGHPYTITGKVIEGKQNGRKIGFPTANIQIADNHKLIPIDGVYAVRVLWKNKSYKGMLNIGFRPTLNGLDRSIEVNIFDFDKTINKEIIKVELLKYVRPEKKFTDLAELKKQLGIDKQEVLQILNSHD